MSTTYFTIQLNALRGRINATSDPIAKISECKKIIKLFLSPSEANMIIVDEMIPDYLVTDSMVERFLAIEPPLMRTLSEFEPIIDEIERTYVLGAFFSALSASVVTIERMLNKARIELHSYVTPKVKRLWGKGPSNAWQENVEALAQWGYLESPLVGELGELYEIRCNYLHSGPINNLENDTLKSVLGAYALLKRFIGFPQPLFNLSGGTVNCVNPNDPLFKVFYAPSISSNE